jgi:UDP-N-acetyl-2-amino-2-deoxyglucuronate dehydrogenase
MRDAERLGFAILGTGVIADRYRQAIAANADRGAHLVAVGHYDPNRFAELGARFGVPCLTLDNLLTRDDLDVLCIATPSGQHAAQTVAAAEAGKHVLVEKPMALSLADADAMIAACKAAGVQLGVCLQRRTEPVYRQMRQAVIAGDLGDLTLGLATMPYLRAPSYFAQAAWRGTWALDGGGVLMNQGIHQVDLLIWLMGDPVEVRAQAATLQRAIEVEDTLAATLRFANGALATITATTTADPGFPHRIELYGSAGAIRTEGEVVLDWKLVDPTRAKVAPLPPGEPTQAGAGSNPRAIGTAGHTAVVRDLIGAIRESRAPQVDGREGRRSLATVLAIYRAAGLIASLP